MNKLCECGCGKETSIHRDTKQHNKFISGHNKRILNIVPKIKIICQLCNLVCVGYSGLSNHIIQFHKIKKEEYYNKYFKKNKNEGLCLYCNKETKFYSISYGYHRYCSLKCSASATEVQEKIKQTNTKKYGGSVPYCSKEIQEKGKQSYQKHYGVDHWANSTEGKLLHRVTAIKRVEIQKLNGEPLMPNIGSNERSCLDEIEKLFKIKIIRNNHNYVNDTGRFPDGDINGFPIFIQYNERHHYLDNEYKIENSGTIQTTLDLASSGHIIFNISEKDWKNNKEQVISNFKNLISQLSEQIKNTSKEIIV